MTSIRGNPMATNLVSKDLDWIGDGGTEGGGDVPLHVRRVKSCELIVLCFIHRRDLRRPLGVNLSFELVHGPLASKRVMYLRPVLCSSLEGRSICQEVLCDLCILRVGGFWSR